MVDIQEWPIPQEVTPANRVCVSFTIPDNDTYRQIVLGWMNQLCYYYNWEKDTGHNAIICSNLFKQSRLEMIQSLTEGCMGDDMYFRMRINPDDQCTSEAQYEPEGDWIPFMSQCCCDGSTQVIEHRVSPTTGQLEISTDGGITWIPDPESPINTTVTEWPAPVTSGVSATKCDAATNGKQHIEDLIAGSSEWLETAGTILELAVGVCTALLVLIAAGSVGTLAPAAAALATAIWAAAAAALEIGKTAFDAYWDSVERDKITCALFCTIGDDGSFTEAQYNAFLSKWTADATPSPAFNLVLSTLKAGGRKGLNNLCSYGSAAEADCSDCNCGNCDFSAWEQWVNGVVLEQDETHIVIQAVFNGTSWNAGIRNVNIDACCCNVQIVAGEGELVNTIGYVPCGLTNDDQSNMSFTYVGQLANAFALAATAAFTVNITGNSEGDCV
jgi:hypothetical protein